MNIAFWAASEDGSSWYRCDQPANALRWREHTVWASKVLPESVRRWSDVIVASRVAKPGPTQVWHDLHAAGRHLVMDFDDDYWHLPPGAARDAWTEPGVLDRLTANTRLAHRVTCASEGLAEVLRAIHPDVRVIPNGLHAQYLGAPRRYDSPHVRVGWAGTATSVTELHLAARALNRIVDYDADGRALVDAVYLGATPDLLAEQGIRVGRPRVSSIEWVDGTEQYLRALMGVDVLVAPYRSSPFNDAKFPTKCLEAGMLGIPLVASDIRPYRDWVGDLARPGENGVFLVDESRPYEWSRWLKALVDDPGLRAGVGAAGRARASANVLQDLGGLWESALTFEEEQ